MLIQRACLSLSLLLFVGCNGLESSETPEASPRADDSVSKPQVDKGSLGGIENQGSKTEAVEATGYGVTFDAALSHALVLAVGEVNGTRLNVGQQQQFTQVIASHGMKLKSQFGENIINAEYGSSYSSTPANGGFTLKMPETLTSFKVISANEEVRESREGSFDPVTSQWMVNVSAEVVVNPSYTPSEASRRLKIAVSPLRYDTNAVGANIGKAVSKAWETSMTDFLSDSDRVAIVDRSFQDDIEGELDLLLSDNIRQDQVARLQQMVGADYILVGSIDRANVTRDVRTFEISGKTVEGPPSASLKISYRLIETATSVLEISDSYSRSGVKSVSLSSLADAGAKQAGENFLTRLFPPRVEKLSNGKAYIGVGPESVEMGDKFDIYKTGIDIVDSYTGEVIGQEETMIGSATVAQILPRMAVANFNALNGVSFTDRSKLIARSQKEIAVPVKTTQAKNPSNNSSVDPSTNPAPKPEPTKPKKVKSVDELKAEFEDAY